MLIENLKEKMEDLVNVLLISLKMKGKEGSGRVIHLVNSGLLSPIQFNF